MSNILVVAEQFKGKLRKASLNAIGAAQALKAKAAATFTFSSWARAWHRWAELAGSGQRPPFTWRTATRWPTRWRSRTAK